VWVLMTPKGRSLSRRWYCICVCGSRRSTNDKLKHNNILCDDQLQIGLVRDGWFSKKNLTHTNWNADEGQYLVVAGEKCWWMKSRMQDPRHLPSQVLEVHNSLRPAYH
jgi:hypothetical protein